MASRKKPQTVLKLKLINGSFVNVSRELILVEQIFDLKAKPRERITQNQYEVVSTSIPVVIRQDETCYKLVSSERRVSRLYSRGYPKQIEAYIVRDEIDPLALQSLLTIEAHFSVFGLSDFIEQVRSSWHLFKEAPEYLIEEDTTTRRRSRYKSFFMRLYGETNVSNNTFIRYLDAFIEIFK